MTPPPPHGVSVDVEELQDVLGSLSETTLLSGTQTAVRYEQCVTAPSWAHNIITLSISLCMISREKSFLSIVVVFEKKMIAMGKKCSDL